jgi:hypothetical protein
VATLETETHVVTVDDYENIDGIDCVGPDVPQCSIALSGDKLR